MTRSEEELAVGTRQRETGRARLRKYVVTEDVTDDRARSSARRSASSASRSPTPTSAPRPSAPAISEEEHEVTLHAEEPVVEKRVVPKERVRLEKDTVTDEQQVNEEVRKERIETDGDIDVDGRRDAAEARERPWPPGAEKGVSLAKGPVGDHRVIDPARLRRHRR